MELVDKGGKTSGRGWRGFCYYQQPHLCVCVHVCAYVSVMYHDMSCVCVCVCTSVWDI